MINPNESSTRARPTYHKVNYVDLNYSIVVLEVITKFALIHGYGEKRNSISNCILKVAS